MVGERIVLALSAITIYITPNLWGFVVLVQRCSPLVQT